MSEVVSVLPDIAVDLGTAVETAEYVDECEGGNDKARMGSVGLRKLAGGKQAPEQCDGVSGRDSRSVSSWELPDTYLD